MIVAHGHFSRVFISRWVQFPLCLGKLKYLVPILYSKFCLLVILGTHFNVEPAGVRNILVNISPLSADNLISDRTFEL